MKHPVDTSQWGEFVVGELFDVHPTKAYKLKNSELLTTTGKNPVVVNSSYNNGIGGYTDQELTESGGILTFSDTTSGADTLFFQEKPFVGYPHVQGMYPKTFELTTNVAKFMIASLRASINKYSWNYTNKLTRTFITSTTVKLPLKPSAIPSNYTQEDIDWTYMETVMSRVTARAKERLANLPQPTDKQKTPVDTSAWGDFVVGELFDTVTRGTRLKKSDRKPGPTPLVTAGSENQGIAEHILENKELFDGVNLTIDMFGNVFARNYPFYADDNILVLKTNVHTFNQIQFMAGSLAHLANEYGYTNQFRQNTLNNTTIKLPLKPSADLSNYTQEDIDWDYMENFMKTIEEKAQTRLKSLQKTIA